MVIEVSPYYFVIYRIGNLSDDPILEGPFMSFPFIKTCARYTIFRIDAADHLTMLETGRRDMNFGVKVYVEKV